MAFSASDLVPVVHHLGEIYDDEAAAVKRYNAIAAKFRSLYGCDPAFYARAPGRVNLIGEHIDYCGYSVLPMAIQRDTVIAGNIQTSASVAHSMTITNTDNRYSVATFADSKALFTIAKEHHWYKYVQCGFKGIFNALRRGGERAILHPQAADDAASADDADFTSYHHHKLQLLVDGNVPPSAGLSSSSSLVCASALCASFSHSFLPVQPKRTLANVCCQCERYVGTMGGGMDQAISFLSTAGAAQRIDFDPLVNTPVVLPRDSVFVVCNSLFESEKAVSAAQQFNLRVLECKLAALILAKHFNMSVQTDTNKPSDGAFTVSHLTFKKVAEHANVDGGMAKFVASHNDILHAEAYTLSEVERVLGVPSLSALLSYNVNFASVMHSRPSLRLRQRALHVYSESQRVLDFQRVCSSGSASVSALGLLMNESHRSCRDEYECSCDDLEVLIAICNKAGALGCRLTGAGWGGCAVALFDGARGEQEIAAAIETIKQRFYYEHKHIASSDPRIADYIFTTKPASGAAVYVPPSQESVDADGQDACAYHSHVVANTSLTETPAPQEPAASQKWWNELPLPWHVITFVALGIMTGLVIAVTRTLAHKPLPIVEPRVTSATTASHAGAAIVAAQNAARFAHAS